MVGTRGQPGNDDDEEEVDPQPAVDLAAALAAAQAQATAIQQLVTNAIAAAAAAAAAAAPAAVPAQPAAAVQPAYARFPGGAAVANDYLDFSKPEGRKVYATAVKPLEIKYDMKSEGLPLFLDRLAGRATESGWFNTILMIPDGSTVPITRNLVTHYGLVTMNDIRRQETTILTQQSRAAQDSGMLYMFIKQSLTDQACNTIMQRKEEYTVNDQESGPLLLKLVVGVASVDTVATIHVLRDQISALPQKMTEMGSNIRTFNTHVMTLQNALRARGANADELLLHVFKAYLNVADADFVSYVKLVRTNYETGAMAGLTVESLMATAQTTYDLRVQDGTWTAADTTKESIVALQAMVADLKKKRTITPTGRAGRGGGRSAQRTPQTGSRPNDGEFAWKDIPPKEGEPKKKKVNKRWYHWCAMHLAWTVHAADKCRLTTPVDKTKKEDTPSLVQSNQAIEENDEDEDDQSQEE